MRTATKRASLVRFLTQTNVFGLDTRYFVSNRFFVYDFGCHLLTKKYLRFTGVDLRKISSTNMAIFFMNLRYPFPFARRPEQ